MANFFYFMHVPWGWIKQRPHFLAEELSDSVDIKIFLPKVYRKYSLINNKTNLPLIEVWKFPLERYRLFRVINYYILQFLFKYIYNLNTFSHIWLTDLRLYPYIKKIIHKKQIVVYDCMDDVVQFDVLKKQYIELKTIEKELFSRANIILFSSDELSQRKIKEYRLETKKCDVVYNAFDENLVDGPIYNTFDHQFDLYQNNSFKVLTYIGTISNWFDFKIIERSLNEFNKIVYFIVGPIEPSTQVFKHERIIYFGSVEHKYVKSLILKSDALIMPFKVNTLTEAVDPVKLYEYIALGAKVLSIKYKELDKFGKYISLYEHYDEFREFLKRLDSKEIGHNKPIEFIQKNSWNTRKKQILVKLLEN